MQRKEQEARDRRNYDHQLAVRQNESNAIIEQEILAKRAADKLSYKDELDRQMERKVAMRGYGNMTQEEKNFNKLDLQAYKAYEGKNYSLIPGIQNEKII